MHSSRDVCGVRVHSISLAAAKAALHRRRLRRRKLADASEEPLPALAADPANRIVYVVLLDRRDGRIAAIRDFQYRSHVMES